MGGPLSTRFYESPPAVAARNLLGKVLWRISGEGVTAGLIVETEAYLGPADPGSHAVRGRRGRAAVTWSPPARSYRHCSFRLHYLLNIVAGPTGSPGAVLIRAVEPRVGIPLMQQRRGRTRLRDLTRGPGCLTQAFAIGRSDHDIDVTNGDLVVLDWTEPRGDIVATTRIGLSRGGDLPLRFYLATNRFISRK